MKFKFFLMVFIFFSLILGVLPGDESGNAIQKAEELERAGKLKEAISLLETAYQKAPEDVTICATLGFYKGMMAGKTKDFMEAGQFVNEAFTLLDKAVDMAENATLPRFYRGILGVNTPTFLGKLDTGITDLEKFIQLSDKSSPETSERMVTTALTALSKGFAKKTQFREAIDTLRKARALMKKEADQQQIDLKIQALEKQIAESTSVEKESQPDPEHVEKADPPTAGISKTGDEKLDLAARYMKEKNLDNARKVLNGVVDKDPENLPALKMLLEVLTEITLKGYDENVHEDTAYRTKQAFAMANLTEKICKLAPDDMEMRLKKGAMSVSMPFFVNKLDQGIADLKMVLEGDSTDEQKAQALYYLGVAHQKIKTTYWIKVAKKYGKTKAAKSVFAGLMPTIKRVSQDELTPPCLKIDFILGFRDELAPQTAVWIENAEGEFVKTVYVSGFCGYAREKQVDLPQWGKKSEFRDVDGVTSASIDQGHHVYIWDLKDYQGKKVSPGEYRVRVETHFWPSMMYQRADVYVQIGSTDDSALHEKGNLIPFLKVDFHPAAK